MVVKGFTNALIIFFLIRYTAAFSQVAAEYPQGYFRNPLDIPILLAGNFGECRPGHFHSGIDIKTGGKENLTVHAAADGYISRIKTDRGGFGHAIYITHPNGYTTLYAHLNDYMPKLQQYLRRQQYRKEDWELDISFDATQFPVKKGDLVAWSGNTGASTAPHLHFEIRDTKTEHPLNPQLFGFDVADRISPVMYSLAFYNMDAGIYEQRPKTESLKKKNDLYMPAADTIFMYSTKVGVALKTDDFMNGSDNTLAFYTAELYMDEALQCRIKLDDIGYDATRNLHAYVDYKMKEQGNGWYQCLFRLPGNQLGSIYTNLNANQGILDLSDRKIHLITIVLTDAAGNQSSSKFYLNGMDMQTDSAIAACDAMLLPGQKNVFANDNVMLTTEDNAMYDRVCFRFGKTAATGALSPLYSLHYSYVPLHSYAALQIKPSKPVPFDLKNKVAMLYKDGKNISGKAAALDDNGWYKASVRNFGNYQLVKDTTPPRITPLQKQNTSFAKASQIIFKATDEITSVKSFRAELDGKWLLFEQRGTTYFYKFDEHCNKGKHTIRVVATDENGNTATLNYSFTR